MIHIACSLVVAILATVGQAGAGAISADHNDTAEAEIKARLDRMRKARMK